MERRRRVEEQKNNPQEDMLFIQKKFRNYTQGMVCSSADYESRVAALKKKEGEFNALVEVYD